MYYHVYFLSIVEQELEKGTEITAPLDWILTLRNKLFENVMEDKRWIG